MLVSPSHQGGQDLPAGLACSWDDAAVLGVRCEGWESTARGVTAGWGSVFLKLPSFFWLVCMDLTRVGLRAGFAHSSQSSPALGFGIREDPDCFLPSKPVPQNLSSLSGPLGLLEATPLGTSGDGMVPAPSLW